jgi:nicotinamidase-related amidase
MPIGRHHCSWRTWRNSPEPAASSCCAGLGGTWAQRRTPTRYSGASISRASTYRPGQPGNEFKPEAAPLPGETIIVKHANSAFIGTEFDRLLRQSRIYTLVIMGVITNNSLEATVRMSGNLGFETYLVEDASFTFARKDDRGRLRTAEEVHDMSLANLDRQYCTVTQTKQVLQAVAGNDRMG